MHPAGSLPSKMLYMRGSRTFCQWGSNFDKVFFFCGGGGGGFRRGEDPKKYHYKLVIIAPPAKRHLNAFHWRVDNGPKLNTGLAWILCPPTLWTRHAFSACTNCLQLQFTRLGHRLQLDWAITVNSEIFARIYFREEG